MAPVDVSSSIDWLGMAEIVGASLTGLTVSMNRSTPMFTPSLAVIVISVVPDWFSSGTMVRVRTPLVPWRRMFALGIRAWLLEEAPTISDEAGVSESLTVKVIAPVELSSLVDRSAIAEMMGVSSTSETLTRIVPVFSAELLLLVSVALAVTDSVKSVASFCRGRTVRPVN